MERNWIAGCTFGDNKVFHSFLGACGVGRYYLNLIVRPVPRPIYANFARFFHMPRSGIFSGRYSYI